jgi:hypothetical protein
MHWRYAFIGLEKGHLGCLLEEFMDLSYRLFLWHLVSWGNFMNLIIRILFVQYKTINAAWSYPICVLSPSIWPINLGSSYKFSVLIIIGIWEVHLAILTRPNGKLSYYTFSYWFITRFNTKINCCISEKDGSNKNWLCFLLLLFEVSLNGTVSALTYE